MDHSYEEIRKGTIDILAGREKATSTSEQYVNLRIGVAAVLQKKRWNTTRSEAERDSTFSK